MSRWPRGEAEVEHLLGNGDLQRVTGAAANGEPLLVKASMTLRSARAVVDQDADSAFVLAYDAACQALTALLAQQGLRPTSRGGHYAVEQVARAQFGAGFRAFGALRRRRNELEYPQQPGDDATGNESVAAIAEAHQIIEASAALLPQLGLF